MIDACGVVIDRESLIVAEVNADEDHELGERFNIQGFPTLKFFPAGSTEPIDYEGGREAKDPIAFVNEKIGFGSSPDSPAGTHVIVKEPVTNVVVLTPANFNAIVKESGKVVFVKFYAPVREGWCRQT